MKKIKILGLILLFGTILAQPSSAYLDPGTGSMVIQIIVASCAAVAIAVKSFWVQLKNFFANLFTKKDKTNDQ